MDIDDINDIETEQEKPKPWRDEETLRRLYIEEELSQLQIAKELGCHEGTVRRWMNELDIETR